MKKKTYFYFFSRQNPNSVLPPPFFHAHRSFNSLSLSESSRRSSHQKLPLSSAKSKGTLFFLVLVVLLEPFLSYLVGIYYFGDGIS